MNKRIINLFLTSRSVCLSLCMSVSPHSLDLNSHLLKCFYVCLLFLCFSLLQICLYVCPFVHLPSACLCLFVFLCLLVCPHACPPVCPSTLSRLSSFSLSQSLFSPSLRSGKLRTLKLRFHLLKRTQSSKFSL